MKIVNANFVAHTDFVAHCNFVVHCDFVVLVHCNFVVHIHLFEPRHEKTGFLHMRKQRRRSASR